MCEEYNGWTNYPTWNVALWLGNDEGLYHEALEIARQDFEYEFERDQAYREFVESLSVDMLGASMTSDLLGWALANVDWRAITESYKEQVAEMDYD